MDLRGWKWKSPWEKRNYLLCILFYLNLLLHGHRAIADGGFRQEIKNEIQDATKLDSLNNYLPYDSKEDADLKRASSFFPLRGKKFSSDDTIDHQLIIPDEEDDKRSQFFPLRGKKVPDDLKRASYFTPMRGRKDDGWFDDYDITDENPYKRASSFMPMRGKKKYEAISDYLSKAGTYSNDIDELLNLQNSNSYHPDDKRMSFVPVRGKRSSEESTDMPLSKLSEDDTVSKHAIKKRSVSFMPMRGRKDSDDFKDNAPGSITTTLLEKKKYSFLPMRGRREHENDEQSADVDKKATFMPMRGRRENEEQVQDLDKKATFMPMRGRRENYDNIQDLDKKAMFMPMRGRRENGEPASLDFEDESLIKRAHSFMPMRGRRTQSEGSEYDNFNMPEQESQLIDDKRASSFMPMRGRRTQSEGSEYDNFNMPEQESQLIDDKRASSFMPMRGRRSVSEENVNSEPDHYKRASSFLPMRGRRAMDSLKNEISGNSENQVSFTPVRVRRSVDENVKVDPWPADQLMSLLDKKASSFMPMRGRRFMERNITVDPWQADLLMSLFNKKSFSFMPMRGRRSVNGSFTVEPWQADQLMSLFNKKSTFMPMRGRRLEDGNFTVEPWPSEQLMSLFNKRSAFLPMRGRRENTDYAQSSLEDIDYDENGQKRSSYFMPMRGRRLESKEMSLYSPYPYFMAGIGSSLMYKPYSDVGLSFNTISDASERRKKLKINWDAVKRAFHASRGKRFDPNTGMNDLTDKDTFEQYDASNLKDIDPKELMGQEIDLDQLCTYWRRLKNYEPDGSQIMNSYEDYMHWCNPDGSGRRGEEVKEDHSRAKRSIRLALQPNRQYIALKRPMSFFATRGKRMDDSAIDNISKLH